MTAEELAVSPQDLVPVCLDRTRGLYNVDVVWAKMLDVMPAAEAARLVRVLTATASEGSWRRLWLQTRNAGLVIVRSLTSQQRRN